MYNKIIEGKITLDETQHLLESNYEENPQPAKKDIRTEEADKVSVHISPVSDLSFSLKKQEKYPIPFAVIP